MEVYRPYSARGVIAPYAKFAKQNFVKVLSRHVLVVQLFKTAATAARNRRILERSVFFKGAFWYQEVFGQFLLKKLHFNFLHLIQTRHV